MNDDFNYTKEIGGLIKDSNYSYKGIKSKWRINQRKLSVKVLGYGDIPHKDK